MNKKPVLVLCTTFLAAFLLVGTFWSTAVATQTPSADTSPSELDIISEMTGFVASYTAQTGDCHFSDEYQVYLCELTAPLQRTPADPVARAAAISLLTDGGALFIPDSTNKRLMVFDPESGDRVDPDFIQLDDAATGTAIHAILGPSANQILISDQTRDVVHEYDFDGNYLGIFAPVGGQDQAIMRNIRGMALRPNGHLLVTVGQGDNANSVVEFDTAGNYVGQFIDKDSGGLASPYDVYQRPGVDWLVSSITNNRVLRYELSSGAFITQFAAVSSFPQQIYEIGNGNILVGNFSGTPGVHEFEADGTPVGVYNPAGVSEYRGVYELPNGNLLTSTSAGVFEIDRNNTLIDTKYSGQSRFIEFVLMSAVRLNKTVGLDNSICADTNEISVPPNTAVTYCYLVTNTGLTTLTRHDLDDSHLGTILDNFTFTLTPGASVFLTQTAVISQTTVNTATWTAYNPGPADVVLASASATVLVEEELFLLYLPVILKP